jgi:hypothetical protein|tara:strand:- start:617 stop:763 length:147 start_codon:yes stop_codon:yes gene_type:complete
MSGLEMIYSATVAYFGEITLLMDFKLSLSIELSLLKLSLNIEGSSSIS